jgi:hypothetical protein
MAQGRPKVELLWWEGCPSTPEALAILREEMTAVGLDPEIVEMREVPTDEEADREEFVGSPTIRVNGADVQAPNGEPVGLTCRVYRLRDGRISPVPDRADVHDALVAAIEEGGRS